MKLDGEAFFDVASDRDHLFFVKTNTVVVKVVGTSFNVKMYKDTDDTEVVLERGVVKLQFGDNDNMITMQPGQKIYYSPDHEAHRSDELSNPQLNYDQRHRPRSVPWQRLDPDRL